MDKFHVPQLYKFVLFQIIFFWVNIRYYKYILESI